MVTQKNSFNKMRSQTQQDLNRTKFTKLQELPFKVKESIPSKVLESPVDNKDQYNQPNLNTPFPKGSYNSNEKIIP